MTNSPRPGQQPVVKDKAPEALDKNLGVFESGAEIIEDLWKSIVKEVPAVILFIDQEGVITLINKPFAGMPQEKLVDHSIFMLLDIQEQELFKEVLEKVFHHKASIRHVFRVLDHQGAAVWYENHIGPLVTHGAVKTAVCLSFDITEKRASEELLKEMSIAVKFSPISAVITDRFGNIEYVNPKFTDSSGYRFEEVKGKILRIMRQGELPVAQYDELWKVIRSGSEWRGEFIEKRKNGTEFWEAITITAVIGLNGVIQHYVVLKEDITNRKRMEEELLNNQTQLLKTLEEVKMYNLQLEQAQGQLVQQEKLAAIGFLAAGVAHEINNPLGFIQGNLTAMEEYSVTLLKMVDYFYAMSAAISVGDMTTAAGIKQQADASRESLQLDYIIGDIGKLLAQTNQGLERIKKIVLGLKSFSRTDSGEMVMANVNEILDGVINILWNEIKYKIELVKEFNNVPLLQCNPQQLGQVFLNLILNAAQAIPHKGIITLRTYTQNGAVIVDICDTGVGIPDAIKDKIFDPFFTTKEAGKGTGLGLCISYDIVKKHGGKIEVKSQVGEGSVFTLIFPVPGSEPKEGGSA